MIDYKSRTKWKEISKEIDFSNANFSRCVMRLSRMITPTYYASG